MKRAIIVFWLLAVTVDVDAIVEAIYWAEGGAKAVRPYGVLAVNCESREECREICARTVRKNLQRWRRAGEPDDFISFLAARYAPRGAENDPQDLNRYWEPNVRQFLAKAVA